MILYESLLGWIFFHRLSNYATFFVLCIGIAGLTSAVEIILLNRKLVQILLRYRTINRLPRNCKRLVDECLREHNHLTYLILYGNRHLFSWIMYGFLNTNVPINVYLISSSTVGREEPLMHVYLYWWCIVLQLLAFTFSFIPLAWCCSVFHKPRKSIPTLQGMIKGHFWMDSKLKYDTLYGRLLSEPKLAITVGPLVAITFMSTFDVSAFGSKNGQLFYLIFSFLCSSFLLTI